jgi:ligand-binding sensor domain-containing protein/serine phosphatase RsbU (regulator of sigma subunit)
MKQHYFLFFSENKSSAEINRGEFFSALKKIISLLRSRKRISIPAALFFVLSVASAQTTSFISIGTEHGLVQSQVQCVTQDDYGNLWIGTLAGISKYNGTTFTNYTKKDGLAEDWITTVYKSKEGNLWFGHWAGNVTRWNKKTDQFENLNLEEYTRFKSIRGIVEDEKGRFWIATEGAGVFIFDPKENKMFALTKKDGLGSDNIYGLTFDNDRNLWFATDSGLTVYNLNKPLGNPQSFIHFRMANGFYSNKITAVYYNSYGEIWVGSADRGVGVLSMNKKIEDANISGFIASQHSHFTESAGLKSNFVKTIFEDHDKNMWIGTIGGGISLFLPANAASRTANFSQSVFKSYSTREGLNYFNVNGIYEDREFNLWIGTDIGLNQFRGERMQTYDENDQLPNNIVWSVLNDSQSNLWLGTNNGLCKVQFSYSAGNKIESRNITTYTTADGLPGNVIYSLFEDKAGNIWVGTGLNGVAVMQKGSNRFISYNTSNGLANDIVYSITEDRDGNIWMGTKGGASKFHVETKEFRNYTVADGLGGNHIYRVFRDSKGQIWIGPLGGALCVFDGFAFKKYDESAGLVHKFILSINEDKEGNIWFGCYGGGLYKFDGKKFTNYSTKDGMRTESPYSIIADNENNIWIGHTRGIEKFNTKTSKFYSYGRSEGFQGVECNPNSISIDKNGCVWFGTIMGAVKFNPAEDKPNNVKPISQILGIKVHLRDTIFPADNEFAYNDNNITFKFVGVSLSTPDKIKYEYTLEGFDKGWVPGKGLNEVVYTNISPGTYKFRLRSCNNNEVWSEPVDYEFTVNPPFWQTAVFYVLVGVFIVFGVFVYDKVRNRNLKRAKQVLEKEVEKRTIELAIKNEELAEKNKDITDSIRYAKRLQDASLPTAEEVKKLFQTAFVFFKPKDIVSGDFFWCASRGDIQYCAVIDCTGHGVPGAFLSIIANNLLNEAFTSEPSGEPAKILDRVNQLASKALHATLDEYKIRDGMDIALIAVNAKEKKASFAGAYNSLYLVRNSNLEEYKANSLSIGSYEPGATALYTNHKFDISKGDQLYLFTDGFADQFGGDKGKKFKYRSFQQLLVANNTLDPEQQKRALDLAFTEWRGELEQVDDVCVVGVRI